MQINGLKICRRSYKRTVDVLIILVCLTFFGAGVFCIEEQSTQETTTQSEPRYMQCLLTLKEKQEICKEKSTNNTSKISSGLGPNSYPVFTVMCMSFCKQHIDINHRSHTLNQTASCMCVCKLGFPVTTKTSGEFIVWIKFVQIQHKSLESNFNSLNRLIRHQN